MTSEIVKELFFTTCTIIGLLLAPWACKKSQTPVNSQQPPSLSLADAGLSNNVVLICGEDDIYVDNGINPPFNQIECSDWFGKPRKKVVSERSPHGYIVRCLCPDSQ